MADGSGTTARARFLAAEAAFKAGDDDAFSRLRNGLAGYPLQPYLDYARLNRDFASTSSATLEEFIKSHSRFPPAHRLRLRLLARYYRQGRWKDVLRSFRDDRGVATQCRWLEARLRLGDHKAALESAASLWMHGRSRPQACNSLFKLWADAGGMTNERVWTRTGLAIDAGQIGLSKYLDRYLGKADQQLAELWRQVREKPQKVVAGLDSGARPERVDQVMVYAIKRQSRRDPDEAARLFETVHARRPLNVAARQQAEAEVGVGFARAHRIEADRWLSRPPLSSLDEVARAWLIMSRLRHRNWQGALQALQEQRGLADDEPERWRYWRARSSSALGQEQGAADLYRELAAERSYYGFLAANRIGSPYAFNDQASAASEARLKAITNQPPAKRARELLALSRLTHARREWRELLRGADSAKYQAAAVVARRWGWHAQAIASAAKSRRFDDLRLRFPVQHQRSIVTWASRRHLDPSWILAVIRQESAFMSEARSGAGAKGLMQLMPGTAREVAAKVGRSAPTSASLANPDLNIELGTAYLSELSQRFGQSPVLASAAYNAGPGRAQRWRPRTGALPADLWVDSVPFRETRRYLRRVLSYAMIYDYRLGRQPRQLLKWMGTVPARS